MENEKRLIDANALKLPMYANKTEDEFVQGYREGKADAILEVMALAPTVDAVEVVRCKDCSKCLVDNSKQEIHLCMKRPSFPVLVALDDFCSYGERRTDG